MNKVAETCLFEYLPHSCTISYHGREIMTIRNSDADVLRIELDTPHTLWTDGYRQAQQFEYNYLIERSTYRCQKSNLKLSNSQEILTNKYNKRLTNILSQYHYLIGKGLITLNI